jgi:hypothetical protein
VPARLMMTLPTLCCPVASVHGKFVLLDAGTIAQIDTVRAGAGGIKTPKNHNAVGSLALARSGAHACTRSSGHSGHTKTVKPVTPRKPASLICHLMEICLKFISSRRKTPVMVDSVAFHV